MQAVVGIAFLETRSGATLRIGRMAAGGLNSTHSWSCVSLSALFLGCVDASCVNAIVGSVLCEPVFA